MFLVDLCLFSLSSGSQKSEIKPEVGRAMLPLEALRENPSFASTSF